MEWNEHTEVINLSNAVEIPSDVSAKQKFLEEALNITRNVDWMQ
jgi:hypothetical protein